jgi:WD40 repeat protein
MDATPDGRTLVVVSKPSGGEKWTLTVVTGALEGKIRTTKLSGVPAGIFASAISPDGRLLAVAARDTVRLWRTSDPNDPIVLNRGKHQIAKEFGATVDFSSDGKRLLLTMDDRSGECGNNARLCVPPFAKAWEVPSGDQLPVADSLVTASGVEEAAFTKDPDTVAVTRWVKSGRQVEIKDLVTGRQLYSPGPEPEGAGGPLLRAKGESVISAVGDRWYTQSLGRTPGPKTAIPAVSTSSDATGNYNVDGSAFSGGVAKGGYAESTLTDVRTGQAYRTRLPTSGETPAQYTGVAAVPRKGGGLTVLVPVGTTLMAVRAEPSGNERFQADASPGGSYALAPDGRFIAKVDEKTLEVMNASRTRLRSVKIPIPAREDSGDLMVTWTADSRWVVVWGRDSGLHRAYAAQNLGEGVPLPGAVQKGKKVDSVVGLQGSEIVLLTENGTLARLDAVDGTVLTQPFLAHPGPNTNGPLVDLFISGQLMSRPGHLGQVAVVTRAGGGNGEILLWDVRAPRRVAVLTGPVIDTPYTDDSLSSGLVFTPDGSRLAVQNSDGQVRVWDVDHRKLLPGGVSRLSSNELIGFDPDGSLVSRDADKGLVEIHDPTDGSSVTLEVTAKITEEISTATARIMPGYQLLIDNGAGRRTFDLRPKAQFDALCTAVGRDYTKDESELLPKGTPSGPPCP